MRVLAWRGDTAYSVVSSPTGRTDPSGRDIERLALIALVPGSAPRTLLAAPGGTVSMSVATDYVDVFRPTRQPETGWNTPEVNGRLLKPVVLLAPGWLALLATVAGLIRRRRRRRHVGVRMAPNTAAQTNT